MCELPQLSPAAEHQHKGGSTSVYSAEGWGWGRGGRQGETEGRMDDPAKRIREGGLLAAGTTPQGSSKVFSQCLFNH